MRLDKTVRTLKVNETSGYKYKPTPTIILKGQWLESFGFSIDAKVSVKCSNGQLVIVPCDETVE